MSLRIGIVADWVFVAVTICLTLIGVLKLKHSATPRAAMANLRNGEQAPQLPGLRYSDADYTYVAVVSTRCKPCTDSMPFYRRLVSRASATRGLARVVVVGFDGAQATREFLAAHRVEPSAVLGIRDTRLPVNGTPTLVVVDRTGRVVLALKGRLDASQESEVLTYVKAE